MKKIGIAGAGIAGLTLANALKGAGYNVELYDKESALSEAGAAISVWPNALNVIESLGLMDQIMATAGVMNRIRIMKSDGTVLSQVRPQYKWPGICVHRKDLHSILRAGQEFPIYPSYLVNSYEHQKDGKVRINFSNGAHKAVDLLVGADGIHSKVRKQLMHDGNPVFRGYNIWRGVSRLNEDVAYASETYGIGKRFGIVPIGNGLHGWWATANEAFLEDDGKEGTQKKLIRLFGDWHQPIPELLWKTKSIIKNSLTDRPFRRGWHQPGVVLLGDAAHPTTPNLGQGGCMAIEGAYILSQCIIAHGITTKALQSYEELHWRRAKEVVNTSKRLGSIGQLQNKTGVGLRDGIFKLLPDRINLKMMDRFFDYDVTALKYH